jgi:hypothetical protein
MKAQSAGFFNPLENPFKSPTDRKTQLMKAKTVGFFNPLENFRG